MTLIIGIITIGIIIGIILLYEYKENFICYNYPFSKTPLYFPYRYSNWDFKQDPSWGYPFSPYSYKDFNKLYEYPRFKKNNKHSLSSIGSAYSSAGWSSTASPSSCDKMTGGTITSSF